MATIKSRITSKRQVTVPKGVCDSLGLVPGDEMEWVEREGEFTVRKRRRRSRLDGWVGYAKEFGGQDPDELLEDWRGR